MNISELMTEINNLAIVHQEVEESDNGIDDYEDTEIIKKLAYGFIVDYSVINGLVLKGFDFKRYKSDNDYLWYEELLEILNNLQGLKKKERNKRISSELSFLFGHLHYKFSHVDLKL
jgi:VIT1/CCC1 family predicted Fe2+/Mn2+ transporter